MTTAVLVASTSASASSSHRVPTLDRDLETPDGLALSATKGGDIPRTIYVNFDGGTYSPAQSNDSSQNLSSVTQSISAIPRWGDDNQRRDVVDCLTELFAPYEIEFTTRDPAPADHIEAVIGGTNRDLDFRSNGEDPSRTGGIAPHDCAPVENSIAFAFAESANGTREVCEIAAHEIGHSLGLEHQMTCGDVMSYRHCGDKSFLDEESQCGEYGATNCQCGERQNSHQTLLGYLGARDSRPLEPRFNRPVARQIVYPEFDIEIDAPPGTTRVELMVNGVATDVDYAAPWRFTAPDLPAGDHTLVATVYAGSRQGWAALSVHLQEPTPGMQSLGGSCTGPESCTTGLCVVQGQTGVCSSFCDPSASGECPSDMTCVSTSSGQGVCWPGDKGDDLIIAEPASGGCRTSSGSGPLGWMLAWMMMVGARRRRRR